MVIFAANRPDHQHYKKTRLNLLTLQSGFTEELWKFIFRFGAMLKYIAKTDLGPFRVNVFLWTVCHMQVLPRSDWNLQDVHTWVGGVLPSGDWTKKQLRSSRLLFAQESKRQVYLSDEGMQEQQRMWPTFLRSCNCCSCESFVVFNSNACAVKNYDVVCSLFNLAFKMRSQNYFRKFQYFSTLKVSSISLVFFCCHHRKKHTEDVQALVCIGIRGGDGEVTDPTA